MTTLSDCSEDERTQILDTPGAVLSAAVVADGRPSPMEFLKELSAGAKVFRESQKDEHPFIREVANGIRERGSAERSSGQGLPESEEAMAAAIAQAEQVLALLRSKDAADAEAYGAWLVRIATRVSEAAKSKSGGFFSKKVAVSPGERAFIERLTAAVGAG
ncbi:MAG TPA: hypothetical protein VFU12_12605 [Glycomyces sp.]|nr:hypothetical protein [Glycomyces sp.]